MAWSVYIRNSLSCAKSFYFSMNFNEIKRRDEISQPLDWIRPYKNSIPYWLIQIVLVGNYPPDTYTKDKEERGKNIVGKKEWITSLFALIFFPFFCEKFLYSKNFPKTLSAISFSMTMFSSFFSIKKYFYSFLTAFFQYKKDLIT